MPRVLHGEDDFDLHQVIRAMTSTRFDMDHAATLAQANDKLAQKAYDIAILDLTLPDGSGWDLLPKLRALNPPPRVVVLSGSELSAAEAAKVEGALLKSRMPAQLLLDALSARLAHSRRTN